MGAETAYSLTSKAGGEKGGANLIAAAAGAGATAGGVALLNAGDAQAAQLIGAGLGLLAGGAAMSYYIQRAINTPDDPVGELIKKKTETPLTSSIKLRHMIC